MLIVRRALAWIAAAAVLILGFVWLAGWLNDRVEPGEEPRIGVGATDRETAKATAREVDTFLAVPGRLWAENRTRVSSEIVGKITEMAVVAGDRVAVGDTLVRLDRTEFLARVERVLEMLPAERARVKEVQAEYDRDKKLLAKDAVSLEQAETSRRLLAAAKASLGAAEQDLAEAKALLDETEIKATMNGIVVDRLGKTGEVATPGVVLLEIYQPASLRLECSVPESFFEKLEVGGRLRAELGPSQEMRTVTIDEIVPQAETRTRTVQIKASVPGASELLEGQYGRLFAPLG